MDTLILDLRSGIRQLFQQRGSALVAVLTLALGIGVSTAIFSVIDATMLRPLPYPNPEQLVRLGVEEVRANGELFSPSPSMADLRAWQSADDVFSAVSGWDSAFQGRIAEGPDPERIEVQYFTEHYLSMHGVAPVLGRSFTREDTEPGSPLVALLGYGYWQSRFGGRVEAIGEAVRLDDEVATIVGVLPSWFEATTPLATPLRIPADQFANRGTGRVTVYGRLRPGVTIEQAKERLPARIADIKPSQPGVRQVNVAVTLRLEALITGYRTTVNVIAGAVGLILLIAAVNVAGLLLARGATRQSELAVRASLGAGRGRLIRQLMTESLALLLPATALGVLLAWLSLDAIVANIPLTMPDNSPVVVNLTVMIMTIALLVPVSAIFALLPAIRLSRVHISAVMSHAAHQVTSGLSRRGGQWMIAAEIALAVVLVTGSGLMIRSFLRIAAVDLGFNSDGLMTMQVLPLERTPAAHKAYYAALMQRLRTVPGIAAVGLVDQFALGGGTSYSPVSIDGQSKRSTAFQVMPGYFETIGARLREGRFPVDADLNSPPGAVVINQSAARDMFPNGSAVGRELVTGGREGRAFQVIGVISDLRHGGPLNARGRGLSQVFFPLEPTAFFLNRAMTVVVRPSGTGRGLGDELRQTAQSIGPRVLVERIRSADEWFGERVITPRRRTVLLGLLGAFGLMLALVGVFGMTAYAVARRTAEIGVRMAFGARPAQVVRTILGDSVIPIVIGTVVGVAASAAASRVIESFLFETAPREPVTLAIVAIVLATTGSLAALVPAFRAAKVDPVVSLRAQ